MRRGLVVAMLLCLLGSALVLLATSRVWVDYAVAAAAPLPGRRLSATGSELVPAARALALLGLAGAAALPATRSLARLAVGAVLALAGVAVTGLVVRSLVDPMAALRRADAFRYDVTFSDRPGLGAWPYVVSLGGLLLLVAGALVLARGRSWAALDARYEAPTALGSAGDRPAEPNAPGRQPAPASPGDVSVWDALDRGDDPTRT